MAQRVRDDETTPPRAKKFKNNEILSSFSSSQPHVPPGRSLTLSTTSSKMDFDTTRSLKRKFTRSTSDSEDNESHDEESDVLVDQSMSRSTVKRPMILPSSSCSTQESASDISIVSASDKENDDEVNEDKLVVNQEDIEGAKRRKEEKEVFTSCAPIHYHSIEDHVRDEKKRGSRLARLLGAAKIGLEEELAKKVSPEKPNLSIVTTEPIVSNSLAIGSLGSPVTTNSTATTVVNSVPSSIPSVVPITTNPLLSNSGLEKEKPSLGLNLTPVQSLMTPSNAVDPPVINFGSSTNATTPVPAFNFPQIPNIQPQSTTQQMNSLQAIAGNLNFSAGVQGAPQGIIGGGGLFNLNAPAKKPPTGSLSSRRRRR